MLKLFHIPLELAVVLCLSENSPCNASCCVSLRCSRCIWGLRVCNVLVASTSCKNVETRRKTDLSFFNLLLAVADPGEGPWSPLFLDQNELLMNTTLVIDGKSLSVECCLETENAPRLQTTLWHHGRHHRIWARALKLTNMLNANVHKKTCYRHYEVVNSEVKKP